MDAAWQSTFCAALITHLNLNRRSSFYVNLDPAAENFEHQPDLDIRDLISLDDVMEEMGLGPNGGLIFCFEFLMREPDFLTQALEPLTEEYLIIFDMPGQIELYTHVPEVPELIRFLTRPGALDIRLCTTYLLEATAVVDRAKYFAASLSAMSAMVNLALPHLNVFSKTDLVRNQVRKKDFKRFLSPDPTILLGASTASRAEGRGVDGVAVALPLSKEEMEGVDPTDKQALMKGASFQKLNMAVANLLESYGMVNYLQLDSSDEDSVGAILSYIDDLIQYHEAQEPRELKDEEFDEPEED
jgi:GPN-loop GTPase